MALDNDIRLIGSVDFFDGLTTEQLRLIAFGAENRTLSAGRELYREGALADSAYILASGELDLTRVQNGETIVLRTVRPGSMLGDIALIAETRRSTSANARTDCELLRIGRTLFRRILEEYPETAKRLHDRFARELGDLANNVSRLQNRFLD